MSRFERLLDRIMEHPIVDRWYQWLDHTTGRRAIYSFVINVVIPVVLGMGVLAFITWGHSRIDELEDRIEHLEERLGQ